MMQASVFAFVNTCPLRCLNADVIIRLSALLNIMVIFSCRAGFSIIFRRCRCNGTVTFLREVMMVSSLLLWPLSVLPSVFCKRAALGSVENN